MLRTFWAEVRAKLATRSQQKLVLSSEAVSFSLGLAQQHHGQRFIFRRKFRLGWLFQPTRLEIFTLGTAIIDRQLTGDGERVAQLRFSGPGLPIELADGPGLDAPAQDLVQFLASGSNLQSRWLWGELRLSLTLQISTLLPKRG